MKPLISIIICTYNRAEILSKCLASLLDVAIPMYPVEILVIDNNSSDHTSDTTRQFISLSSEKYIARYILESTVGLSYARNTGLDQAHGNWVFYLDDDAMITASFFTELKNCIDHDFDAFTGIFRPYYITDKPQWLHDSFGSKKSFSPGIGPLGEDYLCGGVMGFKKELLHAVGGFPTKLGMSGNKVAYGEETYVENILRSQNYSLGINPKLEILHLVHPRKYSFMWNLKSSFAIGKSQKEIGFVDESIFIDSLTLFFKHSFIEIPKLVLYRKFKERYSLKYLSLKIIQPYVLLAGRLF